MSIPTPPPAGSYHPDPSSWGGQAPGMASTPPPAQPEPPKTRRRRKDKKAAADPNGGEVVTKKVVNSQFRFAVLLAVVAAAVAGFISMGANTAELYVVRTVVDVPAGAVIEPSQHLEAHPVKSSEDAEDGAISAADADSAMEMAVELTENKRTQYPLSGGEQIHKEDFATSWPTSTPLEKNERLMSITASASDAVAGQIRPGDRVDIAATTEDVASIVFTDIEVVAITVPEERLESVTPPAGEDEEDAEAAEAAPAGDPVPGIYTVRVGDAEAAQLHAVHAGAELTLIYRPADASRVQPEPLTARQVICDVVPNSSACLTG